MRAHTYFLRAAAMVCLVLAVMSCRSDRKKQAGGSSVVKDTTLDIRYAQGFWLEAREGYSLLHIKDPQKETAAEYTFALRERGTKPAIPKGLTVLDLPMERFICMTSLQLSSFIRLGATEKVVGIH